MTDRRKHQVDPSKVKVGDLIAFTYYTRVDQVGIGGTKLVVTDLDTGIDKITVEGRQLVETSLSADFYGEEEKVTKTRAAELLVTSHARPFTVCFEKSDGTERVLRGRLVTPEPLLGRSKVEDLEKPKDRMRLVDHRTIRWLIVDGVKYTVKD